MGDGSPIGDRMHMVGSLCVRDTSPTSPDPGGFMLTVGPSTVVASGAHVAVGIPTHAPGQLYRTRGDTSTHVRLGSFALSFRSSRKRNVRSSVHTSK
jgi:hypothetical protein